MPQSQLRRVGEYDFPGDAAEQDMNRYVGSYGLDAALRNVKRIADALRIDLGTWGLPRLASGHIEQGANDQEPEPSSPSPAYYNRHGEMITEARHKGGLTAWETRRAVDAMVAANPKLTRYVALALYRDEHPRSRAKNLPGPRNDPSKGESSWDTRVRNIIKKHYTRTGKHLSWPEAHQLALHSLQGSRKAA